MTKVVADRGDVHIQVPVDEGGGAVQVPEKKDVTKDDEGDDGFPVPVDDSGGTVHVQTPVNGGGGAVQVQAVGGTDVTKVDEGGDADEVATQGQEGHGGSGTERVQINEEVEMVQIPVD